MTQPADYTAHVAARFVDDDDLVRTGRALMELDGLGFIHVPVPEGWEGHVAKIMEVAGGSSGALAAAEEIRVAVEKAEAEALAAAQAAGLSEEAAALAAAEAAADVRSELSDLADRAEVARAGAETAQVGAETDRGEAQAAASEAAASATNADTAATAAAGSASEAATHEDTSRDAAAAAIAAAVSVAQFQGHGFPEGKVAAPVGSIYTDLDATAGAIRWIKTTGTGNTGWQVEYGNTGWRTVTSWGSNGSLVGTLPNGMLAQEDKNGGIYYRRFNGTVTLSIVSAVAVAANVEIPIPSGFAPEGAPYPVIAFSLAHRTAKVYGQVGNSFVYVSVVGASNNNPISLPADGPSYSSEATWSTDRGWPTTLPGTPI